MSDKTLENVIKQFDKMIEDPVKVMNDNLKPCPFCGHSAGIGQGPDGYFINCTWCSASTDILMPSDNSQQEAIDLWNRRVGDV